MERTNIVLNGLFERKKCIDEFTKFHVDEVRYVTCEEFEKIIHLEDSDIFKEYNKKGYDPIDDGIHGIVILNENGDGIMVDTQGYNYARYMCFAPKIGSGIESAVENEMKQRAVHEMKLYMPLEVTVYEAEDDEEQEINGDEYYCDIKRKVNEANNETGERGLANYLWNENICKSKVYSIVPDVEIVNDRMMGVVAVKITEPLNEPELEDLKDYICGQMSDGWGESFEQHEIKVSDGKIYVHFWSCSYDYDIKTEEEMDGCMNQNEGMGGMSGM